MNNKLLSIIAVFIGLVLPIKMQAQVAADELYAPEFNFEGDNLVMTCETQGAIIYYSMSEFTDDDEAYDLADNMEVNEYTGTAYTEPIPVTKNVVIKAIAKMPQMQGGSDYKVLIYNYTSWKQLLEAIDYGTDVLNRAQNNPNVSDDLKDQLKWAVEEGQMIYGHRGEMPDSHEAEHFTEEILQIAHEIEELLGPTQTDPEPYAVLSNNNTVLTFYYDEKKAERNGMDVGPFSDYSQKRVWNNQSTSITTVVFDDSFANCTTLTSTAYWFYDFEKLTTITGISNLNTDNVINMTSMFQGCSSLTNLNISNLKTDNVTNMRCLFMDCSSLTNLDLSGFNTANVVYMEDMFAFCTSLQSLNLSSFNTEKVTGMASMFQTCINLTSLNVSSFKTDNVSDFRNMFNGCTGLTSLDVSSFKINADNLYSSNGMFAGCSNLKTIYGGDGWNEWKSSNDFVFDGSQMFSNCTALVGGAGTHYDPNHTDYTYAHIDGGTANPGYFTAAGAEPWKDIDAVVLTGKINNYWYDATGTNPDGDEAIIFTIPEVPEEGMQWEFSILGTFIQNQLAFTTADGQAIDNIIGDILFETKGNMVAIQDGKILVYESENERGEIAMVDPYSGMIRIIGNEITLRLLNDPNSKFMALPLRVKAYYNNRDVTVTNGSFTVLVQSPKQVQGPEPYAVLSQNNTVLTFYYDDQKQQRNGMSVGPFTYTYHSETNSAETDISWYNQRENITSIVFDKSFANYSGLTSTSHWFDEFYHISSISGIENLNTSNVTDMSYMFSAFGYYSPNFTTLDLSSLNTSNVTNMQGMFNSCYYLQSINVSNFNTSNVTDMSGMFEVCYSLINIDVSNFNTSNVTDMGSMFTYCKFTSLDVSHFDTRNVTKMGYMFFSCENLVSLDLSNFNTENVTDISYMFEGCSSLTSLDLSHFNTSNVVEMQQMFWRCSSLRHLDVSHFDTSKSGQMWYMFGDCSSLTDLDLSSFTNVYILEHMFSGCSNLVNLNISNFDTSYAGLYDDAYESIFDGCSSLASIQAGSANIPDSIYAEIGNPNLLVYVNEARLAPQGIQNVVINGRAQEIILTDVTEGNNNWHCPEPFTAEKISYTRNFKQQTEVGISRGWESITLPFNVQTITHETKGQIIPFGAQGNGKYFWLRGYSPEGLHRATAIEANKPYVISMPNNTEVYPSEYNLNGRVTFTASNTTVPATPELDNMIIVRDNIAMMPNYRWIPQNEYVYAINVGQPVERYAEGSVFTRNLRDVRPFEAYTTHAEVNGARPNNIRIAAQPKYDITGIKDIENDSMEGPWYSLDGRQMQSQPQRKGIYIQNGKKVVIK